MFLESRRLDAQHRGGGDVHQALSVATPVEAADQRNGQPLALDDTRRSRIDPGVFGERESQHFSLCDGALVRDAGELANAERSVFVDYRAFRAHAAK